MKKTLLIAAATLAAGVITSQAQVYSQNIVGYANIGYPNGLLKLTGNQFVNGNNNATNVFANGLPDGSQIFTWSGTTFNVVQYNAAAAAEIGVSSPWFNGDLTDFAQPPTLDVGKGFFVLAAAAFTNTFVGNIIAPVGGSTTNNLSNGLQSLASSQIPYAGSLTNVAFGFTPPDGTQVFQWNPSTGKYTVTQYNPAAAAEIGVSSPWFNGDLTDFADAPNVSVGEGYFILPAANWAWKQSL